MYFASSKSSRLFARGNTLLFYESGKAGRMAIIAAARSLGATTVLKSEVGLGMISRGVLNKIEVDRLGANKTVTAVPFDNVIMFPTSIDREQLIDSGWWPRNNLVSSMAIRASRLILRRRINDATLQSVR